MRWPHAAGSVPEEELAGGFLFSEKFIFGHDTINLIIRI